MIHIYCPDQMTAEAGAAYLRSLGHQADTIKSMAPRAGLQIMLVTCPEDVPSCEGAGDGPLALVEYDPEDWEDVCAGLVAASVLDRRA